MKGRPSVVLESSVAAVVPAALLFSLYLLFAGHNAPGGGFSGGLVAGAALTLVQVDRGWDGVLHITRVGPEAFLGTGVATMVLVGVSGWLGEGEFLEASHGSWDVPVAGEVELSTTLAFDVGVYLVVVGVVLSILATLGQEERE